MRNFLFFSLFIISFSTVTAQTISNSTTDSTMALSFCQVMPSLTTKEYKSFEEYLKNHLIYPEDARANWVSGSVYVEFIIEIDGSVSNVKIVKGKELYPSCDQEAIRVISNSPKWNPGMQNGKAVRVKKITRISFNLKSE